MVPVPRVPPSWHNRDRPGYWVAMRLTSADAKLLLQARGRRRVLEHQPLVRIDVTVGLLRHQCALVETAQDKLELAGIGVDVANRKNPGHAGLEGRCLDRHQVVLKLDSPIGDRAELHGQPEERQHGIAGNLRYRVVVALDDSTGQCAAGTLKRGDLTDLQIHFPAGDQRTHLLDAVRRGAEIVPPVQQRHALGYRMQVECPVKRRVAATDDQQFLVAELLHLPYRVKHRGAFIGLDPGHRRTLRLERTAARRDHEDLAFEYVVHVGRNAERRITDLLDLFHHLPQMEGRVERLDLFHQRVGQSLASHEGNARNVVDRLLRIKFGTLAADLVENVDQMRLHIEQAQLEHGEQAAGPCAYNQHIGFDRFAHIVSFRVDCAWAGRST